MKINHLTLNNMKILINTNNLIFNKIKFFLNLSKSKIY